MSLLGLSPNNNKPYFFAQYYKQLKMSNRMSRSQNMSLELVSDYVLCLDCVVLHWRSGQFTGSDLTMQISSSLL